MKTRLLLVSCLVTTAVLAAKAASSLADNPFPPDVPSRSPPKPWTLVGFMDMADPTQRCPSTLSTISSPRASCGRGTNTGGCDSVYISTKGVGPYQTVCGKLAAYQIGSTDAFGRCGTNPHDNAGTSNSLLPNTIEDPYVDGVSITYGARGSRQHVFTYAAGSTESSKSCNCPCSVGSASAPPSFVGSDYLCESGDSSSTWDRTTFYYSDILWDGQQCGGDEASCCTRANLPWFCKQFAAPISDDLELRVCTDSDRTDENLALSHFELYIK